MGAISIEYLDNPVSMVVPTLSGENLNWNNTQMWESQVMITNEDAACYDIIHGLGEYEGKVFTDEELGIQYMIGEDGEIYYQAALGSYYGKTGDTFKVTFKNGTVLNIVKTDEKADKDTIHYVVDGKDYGGWYGDDGEGGACIIEYICNTELVDVPKRGFQNEEQFGALSTIVSIEKTGSM